MADRFFSSQRILPEQTALTLDGDEAHHLLHVLRAKIGRRVTVFDGTPREWPAVVAALGKKTVELALDPPVDDPPLAVELTLGVALPKGDRQKQLIEKLVELNTTHFVPLLAERGVAQPVDSALERLRRQTLEACKQCGRNQLLTIGAPLSLAQATAAVPRDSATLNCLLQPLNCPESDEFLADCRAGGTASPWLNGLDDLRGYQRLACWIGPEGGWTLREVREAAQIGCRFWDLGRRLLRVETAAITVAAAALLK